MVQIGNNWSRSKDFSMSSEEALNDLNSNYHNPAHPIAFMGIDKIFKFYNGALSKRKIQEVLHSQEEYSLMKQEKKNLSKLWTPIISFHYLDLGNFLPMFMF